ncbi:MAG: DNA/RNA non-specific endonuclease [Clostridiales bacterium]|nr:DNA/RNA non-specific endonuclease [Clostridiales bacterium]
MRRIKKFTTSVLCILICSLLVFISACSYDKPESEQADTSSVQAEEDQAVEEADSADSAESEAGTAQSTEAEATQTSEAEDRLEIWTGVSEEDLEQADTVDDVPEYEGEIYAVVNDNEPEFTEEELSVTESYESYSELDELGRCGVCTACIGTDIMPTEERGSIGQVKPSGWHTVKYDCVDGLYLYNRCHLIAYELAAENANEENLITGTRYFNVEGMLPLENMVTDFVKETGYHVLYRVTPVFEGDDLVAAGVQMEAESLEDGGEGICYNLFVYNIQPGVAIDYATGDSWESDETLFASDEEDDVTDTSETEVDVTAETDSDTETYVVNTNTKKFHKPTCSSVDDIADYNRKDYSGSRETLISQGFEPCKRCNP